MFRLKESVHVNAPIDRCFLLSTHIGLVARTIKLKPVQGKTSGLIAGGDRLLWRGWKFGLPVKHETLISSYDRPNFFQDTQGQGQFSFFQHDHRFQHIDGRTLMQDVIRFAMPLGPVGHFIGKQIVVPHVLDLLCRRLEMLKSIAESKDWEQYLVGAPGLSEHAPDLVASR